MSHGFFHGCAGDFVKCDAASVLGFEFERLHDVPGDGFSFAVFVRRQVDHVGMFDGGFELSHRLLTLGWNGVGRGEMVFQVHAEFAFRQITNMPEGGKDFVVTPEVF